MRQLQHHFRIYHSKVLVILLCIKKIQLPLYFVKLDCCYLLVSAYLLIYLNLASAYPGLCCMMLGNISCCQATTFSLWTLFPKYDLHRMYYFHIRPYPKIQFQMQVFVFMVGHICWLGNKHWLLNLHIIHEWYHKVTK